MILLLIGSPGSGKGTQAEILAKQLKLVHFSTGEVFREMDDPEIDALMSKGKLVPDEKVIEVFENYIEKKGLYDDILIDGSPRSLYQYNKFKEIFSKHNKRIDFVIYLHISDEMAFKRLTSRREDQKTGRIYNLITNPPGPEVDPTDLVVRDDDKEDAVNKRLKVQKVPKDMLSAIRRDGILIEIDGEKPIETINKDILAKLENEKK